jgi:uncharacterized protein YciI
MQFLYRLEPTRTGMLSVGPTDRESSVLAGHFSYLEQLVKEGKVHLAGRTLNPDERCFGLVIFYANSERTASEIMENDPAVREGVMTAELFPFRIALCASKEALHE